MRNSLKYKLIISDFDGTLLRDDNTVSPRTVEAIKNYVGKGGVFTVSTGRMCKSILSRLPELGLDKLDIPLMGYQGARIISNLTGEVFFERNIRNADAIKLVRDCKEQNLFHQVYCSPERLITAEYNWISQKYFEATGAKAEAVGNVEEFLMHTGLDCHKILAIMEPERSRDVMRGIIERHPYASAFVSHPSFVEMVHRDGSKGIAAKWVAKKLGISIDEVIGIGDSLNDIPLIETVGKGIAVANSMPELKAVANEVSEYTNNEDVVARVLEEIMGD